MVLAIILVVFFSMISLFPNIKLWLKLLIALGIAILCYVLVNLLVREFRKPIVL